MLGIAIVEHGDLDAERIAVYGSNRHRGRAGHRAADRKQEFVGGPGHTSARAEAGIALAVRHSNAQLNNNKNFLIAFPLNSI